MNTSSSQPKVKRVKGSKFIIWFLIGMALFGALGFGVTYWAAQMMEPGLKKRQQERLAQEQREREAQRAAEAAGKRAGETGNR